MLYTLTVLREILFMQQRLITQRWPVLIASTSLAIPTVSSWFSSVSPEKFRFNTWNYSTNSSYQYFLVVPLLHTHCSFGGLLLHLTADIDTYIRSWIPLHNTQHSQEVNVLYPQWYSNPSRRAAADLRLRPRGNPGYQMLPKSLFCNVVNIWIIDRLLKQIANQYVYRYVCMYICVYIYIYIYIYIFIYLYICRVFQGE